MSMLKSSASAGMLRVAYGLVAAAALAWSSAASAVPIDLNRFFYDAAAPISIAADGSSARLGEDPGIFAVFLSNVPGFGDPELVSAVVGARLAFEYEFLEGIDNDDIFHFAVLDGLSGDPLGPFNLFVTQSGSGTASFDLSALVGTLIGLQFELLPDALDAERADSVLRIADLRIEMPATDVDEPGSLALLALGMMLGRALALLLKRRASA